MGLVYFVLYVCDLGGSRGKLFESWNISIFRIGGVRGGGVRSGRRKYFRSTSLKYVIISFRWSRKRSQKRWSRWE
jgi:hypothetical protein